MSSVIQANVPDILRDHNARLRALEGQVGRWVYVLPIAPASDPPGFNPLDPLSPMFQNGWGNNAAEQPTSFRIHPATRIQVRSGGLRGGTIPSVVFTLPENYRPTQGPAPVSFPSSDGTSTFTGRIDTNGDVWILAEITASTGPPTARNGWTGLGVTLLAGQDTVVDFADAGTFLPDFADGLPQPFIDYTDILDPAVIVDGTYCLQIEFNSFDTGLAGEEALVAIYMAQASTNQLCLPKTIRCDTIGGADGQIRDVLSGIWPIAAGDSFAASIKNMTSNTMSWNWITYISRLS